MKESVQSPKLSAGSAAGEHQSDGRKGLNIQPKLTIGSPDDHYERQAEQVADQVMRMPVSFQTTGRETSGAIQRKCAACEHEEEQIQRKPFNISPFIQKSGNDGGGVANEAVSSRIESNRGGGSPMAESTRSFMETRFGNDFSGVKIHTDSSAIQLSQNLNAQAFTVGNDVFFNQGKYNPESDDGKHLLAHELVHTMQQGGSDTIKRQLFLGQGGGYRGVMDRDRARARQMTQQRPPLTLQKIKVWLNTFIPQTIVDGPPFHECFLGDDRGFSRNISASSRTHQEIEFSVPSLAVLNEWRHIGTTHEVNCSTRAALDSDTASINEIYTNLPYSGPVTRYSANEILVLMVVHASNPLVRGAPAIDALAIFHIDPYNRYCYMTGFHDGFPGYEAYISGDGVMTEQVYSFDPVAAGNSISSLFPPMDISINNTGTRF